MGKKKRRGKRKTRIPLAVVGGFAASPAIHRSVAALQTGNFTEVIALLGSISGFDQNGKFNANMLVTNMGPIIGGLLIHKFVGGSPLNLNRMIANSGIPLISI